jgi:hypothetical protein
MTFLMAVIEEIDYGRCRRCGRCGCNYRHDVSSVENDAITSRGRAHGGSGGNDLPLPAAVTAAVCRPSEPTPPAVSHIAFKYGIRGLVAQNRFDTGSFLLPCL